jgi:class 3 adenylate cyclase
MGGLKTLTILKTDMRGFTSKSSTLASGELGEILHRHRALTTRVARRFGGNIFKEMGDSFLIAFECATEAVQAALEIQRDLAIDQVGEKDEDRIEVRATVATGDVFEQGGDFFGEPVNLTARMETVTPACEVYVAESTRLAANRAEISLDFVDEFRFKNMVEPVRVYRCKYRHATREVKEVAIVFTDILSFTAYTAAHSPADVEELIDFCDESHRQCIADLGGVIRLVTGDVYLLTFSDCDQAVEALIRLCDRIEQRNASCLPGRRISLVAGMDYGDLKIYRTAVFGSAANNADFARDVAGHLYSGCEIVLTNRAREKLSESNREKLLPVDQGQANLRVRMDNRGIDSLWRRKRDIVD